MSDIDNEEMQRLLVATARGETSAFNRLYDTMAPRLFAVAITMMREPALAEDVLQDAFVQVWHRAREYHNDRGSVLTWLTTIVRYRAIDLLRKRGHDGTQGSAYSDEPDTDKIDRLMRDSAASDEADTELGPLARAVSMEENSMLKNCIERLSNNQRQGVALAFFRGFTHKELSICLAEPLGTIKSRLRRSLLRLKDCLENLGSDNEIHQHTN